jgi:hypothetical protein
MSEAEKKGSPWPWFLVPIAAVSLFFVLRECRSHLPPASHAPATAPADAATTVPAEPAPADAAPATAPEDPAAAAAPETPPAPQ